MNGIRKAKRSDLPAINDLLQSYGLGLMDTSYINHRDVCLVACYDNRVVGLVWVGLMRQNKQGYVDYFTVDKQYAKRSVGNALSRELARVLHKMGVEQVFGVIEHDEFHDRSAANALKIGMYAKSKPQTYVYGYVAHSVRELGL